MLGTCTPSATKEYTFPADYQDTAHNTPSIHGFLVRNPSIPHLISYEAANQ